MLSLKHHYVKFFFTRFPIGSILSKHTECGACDPCHNFSQIICPRPRVILQREPGELAQVRYFWPLAKEDTDPNTEKIVEPRIMQKPKDTQEGNPRGSPNQISQK